MNKFTTFLGTLLAAAFLIGLATTLTRSTMIGFFDVLPVYILMAIAIFMMVYEAFFDKKQFLSIKLSKQKTNFLAFSLLFIQPIFMSSNLIVARGGIEFVPPISLAFWRWTFVFIILLPFTYLSVSYTHLTLPTKRIV